MERRRRCAWLGPLVVALAVLAGACGSSARSRGADAPTSPPTSARARSAGCAATPPAPGPQQIQVGRTTRTYALALPKDPKVAAPVLVDLHGLGQTGKAQDAYTRLGAQGTARGYVVATPESANRANSWTFPGLPGPDDAGFVAALLDQIEREVCVDPHREFVAGISNGAGLAVGLLCKMPGRLAGIAPVSGINILRTCPAAKPATIVAFHGSADPIIPYEGGVPFANFDLTKMPTARANGLRAILPAFQRAHLRPAEQAVAEWAEKFGCGPVKVTAPASDVGLRTYRECDHGVTVQLYTIHDGGHTWPGASIAVPYLGKTAADLDATRVILDTFDRAPDANASA